MLARANIDAAELQRSIQTFHGTKIEDMRGPTGSTKKVFVTNVCKHAMLDAYLLQQRKSKACWSFKRERP